MISSLRGQLLSASPTCIVSVGGVGFEIQVPERDRMLVSAAGGEVLFHTYLYVREDRLVLFGFLKREDRELFTKLIDVSGIGPKIAINMMAEHSTPRIVKAIRTADHAFLQRLPGLGRKTAERVTVDLKDKLDHIDIDRSHEAPGADSAVRDEAMLALTTLGLTKGAAERALEQIDWEHMSKTDVADVVKAALKHTSP